DAYPNSQLISDNPIHRPRRIVAAATMRMSNVLIAALDPAIGANSRAGSCGFLLPKSRGCSVTSLKWYLGGGWRWSIAPRGDCSDVTECGKTVTFGCCCGGGAGGESEGLGTYR